MRGKEKSKSRLFLADNHVTEKGEESALVEKWNYRLTQDAVCSRLLSAVHVHPSSVFLNLIAWSINHCALCDERCLPKEYELSTQADVWDSAVSLRKLARQVWYGIECCVMNIDPPTVWERKAST